jgi:hypothetical protein
VANSKPQAIGQVRLFLTIELGVGFRESDYVCFAIFSRAGQEGTMTVTWPITKDGMTPGVLEDVMLECDQMITLAVERFIGVQEVLPLA